MINRLRTVLLVLALAAGLGLAAPAPALADNSAVAVNTKDGSSVFKFAFAIRHVMGDVVDETNSAVAYASCTDCHTTAIAIEIVLVEGSPSVFTPTNQAIAVNYQCTLCQTFAAAYQFVIQGSGPMHFMHEGYRELARIKRAIRELGRQNLSPFELQAKLDPLIERLRTVLATQLVTGDRGDHGQPPDEEPPPETDTVETPTEPTTTAPDTTTTTGSTTTETTGTTTDTTTTTTTTTGP